MELAPPHARLTAISRAAAISIAACVCAFACACALASAFACGGGGRSARGPPLPIHIALERAHQALCAAGGVESPRALVASLAPDASCPAVEVPARVRCYLGLSDSTVEVRRTRNGYRFRFAMPRLSDHVHEVTVLRAGDRLLVEVDSRN